MLYIMNLVSLVVLENFELSAVITPSVISNILSNEALGGNIWIFPVILSCVKGQWKVCYNKLKQGNFQKTAVGGETQDICQELAIAVTSGHTKSFFFYNIWETLKNTAIIGQYRCATIKRLYSPNIIFGLYRQLATHSCLSWK